jgi:hypothetical protein
MQHTRFDASDPERRSAGSRTQSRCWARIATGSAGNCRSAWLRDAARGGKPSKARWRTLAARPWLAGETFSLADIAVAPYVNRLDMLGMAQMWEQRHIQLASTDPAQRRAATQRIRAAVDLISPWRVYIDILLSEARTQLRAADTQLAQSDAVALPNSPEADAMQAARYTAAAYERVQMSIDDADRR